MRLDLMPESIVAAIREEWRTMRGESLSVVHGDPGKSNIKIRGDKVGLLDWDEARVDVSLLDLADIPVDLSSEIGSGRLAAARRAAGAWEAANAWLVEPEYARARLRRLKISAD